MRRRAVVAAKTTASDTFILLLTLSLVVAVALNGKAFRGGIDVTSKER